MLFKIKYFFIKFQYQLSMSVSLRNEMIMDLSDILIIPDYARLIQHGIKHKLLKIQKSIIKSSTQLKSQFTL